MRRTTTTTTSEDDQAKQETTSFLQLRFAGAKKGYVFSNGKRGVGYYMDSKASKKNIDCTTHHG